MSHDHARQWMMEPAALAALLDRSRSLPTVPRSHADAAESRILAAMNGDPYDPSGPCPAHRVGDGAVLALAGPLYHGSSWWMDMLGGLSIQLAVARVNALRDDASVRWVLLDVNSPGGTVAGIRELVDAVAACVKVKPVVAAAHEMIASAAYYAVCGATEIVASETAVVGSVGVLMTVDDSSGMFEDAGIKRHLIRSGDLKAVGVMGVPVSDAELGSVRPLVDAPAERFFAQVAQDRGVSVDAVRGWRGAVFVPADALKNQLIDAVEPFAATLARVQKTYGGAGTVGVNIPPVGTSEGPPSEDDGCPEDAHAATPQGFDMDLKSLKAKDVVEGAPDLAREIAALVGTKPEPAATYAQLKGLFGDDLQGVDACITKGMTLTQATAHKAERTTATLAANAAKASADLEAATAKLIEAQAAVAKLTAERDELKKKGRGVATGTIAHEESAGSAGANAGGDEPEYDVNTYTGAVSARVAELVKSGKNRGWAITEAHIQIRREKPKLYAEFSRERNKAAVR